MTGSSANDRLLRRLAELEVAAGLSDPPDPVARRSDAAAAADVRPWTTPGGHDEVEDLAATIRRRSPIVALALPAALGVLSALLLAGDNSAARGMAGFAFAVLAAPALPVLGVPLRSGTPVVLLGVALSAVLWLALGHLAARRATSVDTMTGRSVSWGPSAQEGRPSWGRFVGEYAWMVVAVWVGLAVAVVAVDLVLGRPLF